MGCAGKGTRGCACRAQEDTGAHEKGNIYGPDRGFLVCSHRSRCASLSLFFPHTHTLARALPLHTMGVDYTARKAAKKARKAEGRTSVGKRTSALADRDAGVSGGGGATDKKGKRDRPKHGRKGARRMCKGMCYGAAPMVRDRERDREREREGALGAGKRRRISVDG